MDRKLEQDDNRGLQQGVKDNKKTPNLFRILLERKTDTTQKVNTSPTGYPSLLSNAVSYTLNHPIITLATNDLNQDLDIVTEFLPFPNQLSCDIQLLNLRFIHDMKEGGSIPGEGALLLLHRHGFDCKYPATGLSCSTNQGKVSLGEMFHEDIITVKETTSTSLTMMHDKETIDTSVSQYIEPMEIKAFRMTF
ncbi:alpha-mannosidase 2-like [Saccoglossus kowalevskii]|uniref:Alpha-mannosidase 2-like n=1 Tax=Saccoglossus kowalevskii TaxID=10224 RepID=A0ABM0MB21_SACKO|nr:PREDICTED: alpha-mannosidase 2-like [Saccoglossus kowalevskii]